MSATTCSDGIPLLAKSFEGDEMICCPIDRIKKSVLNPEVNEPHDEPVGNRLQQRGPHVIRHTSPVAKEVGQPGRLDDPNERDMKNPACYRYGHVRAGDDNGRLYFLKAFELAAVGDKMNIECLMRREVGLNRFGDFHHPARFPQIERARCEDQDSVGPHLGGGACVMC